MGDLKKALKPTASTLYGWGVHLKKCEKYEFYGGIAMLKLKKVELRDNQKFSIHDAMVKGKIKPIEMTHELATLIYAQLEKSTRAKNYSITNIETILNTGEGRLSYGKGGSTVCTITAKIMLNHVVLSNDNGGGIFATSTQKWFEIV